jgi:hypothetical protein
MRFYPNKLQDVHKLFPNHPICLPYYYKNIWLPMMELFLQLRNAWMPETLIKN